MLSKRMMFKKFRKWFEPCFNDPLRLNDIQFKRLLLEMFEGKTFEHDDVVKVMKKLGFEERRNIKGTFYIRPTLDFYLEADKIGIGLNRVIALCRGEI